MAVRNGCFHPKLLVLEADDEAHVLVGSANLTFGGWSANLECIDHVFANGMASAIKDVAAFFDRLSDDGRCVHDAADHCRSRFP